MTTSHGLLRAIARERKTRPGEKDMHSQRFLLVFLAVVCLAAGCSSSTQCVRVQVPPRVDLHAYPTVGLVTFSSNGEGGSEVQQLSTQRFLEEIQSAQPGTRVVELGPEEAVLASVHRSSWDAQTLHALKESRGLDVIVIGQLDLRKVQPKVQFSTASLWSAVNVRQDVNATLSARLLETNSGATLWTDFSRRTQTLANANVSNHGGSIGMSDAQAVYGDMIDHLACDITDAFRPHYVTREVPRDQVQQTANAGN
jgi:hypothetical protein